MNESMMNKINKKNDFSFNFLWKNEKKKEKFEIIAIISKNRKD